MIGKLIVFGNVGDLTKPPKGGGQSSSRRVMQGFQEAGLSTSYLSRHMATWKGRIAHIIEVLLFGFIDLCKLIAKMRKEDNTNTAFFYMTFSGTLLPYEYILTKVVKWMGFKRVMYLQGGQFYHYYNNGSKKYKKLYAKVLNMQNLILFEGKEGIKMSESLTTTPLAYFPSYTFNKDIPVSLPSRPTDKIQLIFFGRIDPNKNVHIIIECFEILCKQYDNIYLTIIGGPGKSIKYASEIKQQINQSAYADHIQRYDRSPYSFIKEQMQTHHFFIFPTKEPCEGHSNALSEAMSQGLIPIVSNHNFNLSIVGDESLVVDGYSPEEYAKRISRIIENGEIERISKQMIEREIQYFSYDAVNPEITKMLKSL